MRETVKDLVLKDIRLQRFEKFGFQGLWFLAPY